MRAFLLPSKQKPGRVTTLTWKVLLMLAVLINSSPFSLDRFNILTVTVEPLSNFPLYTAPKLPCPSLWRSWPFPSHLRIYIFLELELHVFLRMLQYLGYFVVNQNISSHLDAFNLKQKIVMHIEINTGITAPKKHVWKYIVRKLMRVWIIIINHDFV